MSGLDGLGWPNPADEPKTSCEKGVSDVRDCSDWLAISDKLHELGDVIACAAKTQPYILTPDMRCQEQADAATDGLAARRSAVSDTERLDWLQANQETVWRVTHDEWAQTTETHTHHEKITVFDGWVVNEQDEPQKDIRAAIDAAMHSLNTPALAQPGEISTTPETMSETVIPA